MTAFSRHGGTVPGWWRSEGEGPCYDDRSCREAVSDLSRHLYVLATDDGCALGSGGVGVFGVEVPASNALPVLGYSPALRLENLGDPSFCIDHRIRYPYVAGAMASGISSAEIVEAMGRHGMLAFFGAAGLSLERVEAEIERISRNLGETPYGFNLIHSPSEPDLEAAIVDLYLQRGVRLVSASAYMGLTLPVVRYRVHGIHRNAAGQIVTPNRIVAKVSRVEVASQFFAPPGSRFLRELVVGGDITEEQARLAEQVPMAQDLTAEADSAGHTDNRPLVALLPTMLALRDRVQARYGYAQRLRVGAAGGISTPTSAAAAFATGAAYILTGSVNQSCREAGTSDRARAMLAAAEQADVAMSPAADMFEMGVKVQVLKRGTMFAMRAAALDELYRNHDSLDTLSPAERAMLEKTYFRASLEEAWSQTRAYLQQRDPAQVARAQVDPKHKMALLFRSYLGQSSDWATTGEPSRQLDYQICCGPAMGAFNEWVKGSFLEDHRNRDVVTVALNILYGGALQLRLNGLRIQGVRIPSQWCDTGPLERAAIEERLARIEERLSRRGSSSPERKGGSSEPAGTNTPGAAGHHRHRLHVPEG